MHVFFSPKKTFSNTRFFTYLSLLSRRVAEVGHRRVFEISWFFWLYAGQGICGRPKETLNALQQVHVSCFILKRSLRFSNLYKDDAMENHFNQALMSCYETHAHSYLSPVEKKLGRFVVSFQIMHMLLLIMYVCVSFTQAG